MSAIHIIGHALISPAGGSAWAASAAAVAGKAAGATAGAQPPLDGASVARLGPTAAGDLTAFPDPSASLAVRAAEDAFHDAGLDESIFQDESTATIVATSKAGALTAIGIAEGQLPAELLWPWGTPGSALAAMQMRFEPVGPMRSIVAACASGLLAIVEGARMIHTGRARRVVIVAADMATHPMFLGGFHRLGVLGRWSDNPSDACRPFSADRTGFVPGEGAGAIILSAAPAGNSDIHARVRIRSVAAGSLTGSIIHHASHAAGLAAILRRCLAEAGWLEHRPGFVHAHATGTPAGDAAEAQAVAAAVAGVEAGVPVISTKPVTGHLLAAAGVAQVILTVEALRAERVPPTANFTKADADCPVNCNPHGSSRMHQPTAICLAHGFGGSAGAVTMEVD